MKIIKVNNTFNLFVFRFLLIIFFCFMTMYVTGRIGDMDVYLGWREYDAGGLSFNVAKNLFSLIGDLGNRYLIIGLLGIILTFIIYSLLRKYIDSKNFSLWQIILLSPGLLIYTNAPTKETLFFYPAILYIILECEYINSKKIINFGNFFLKFSVLLIMFITRGDQAFPYIILTLLTYLLKNFNLGKSNEKFKISSNMIKVFIYSFFFNILLYNFFPDFITRTSKYIASALATYDNEFRPNQFNPFSSSLGIIQAQYLALFPTIGELLQKPYKSIIILDSIIFILSFVKSWDNLFKLIDPYKILKKSIFIIFTFVTLVYFTVYGMMGSANLGASQRLRVNYIPLAIMFPLILEKKFRDRVDSIQLQNK